MFWRRRFRSSGGLPWPPADVIEFRCRPGRGRRARSVSWASKNFLRACPAGHLDHLVARIDPVVAAVGVGLQPFQSSGTRGRSFCGRACTKDHLRKKLLTYNLLRPWRVCLRSASRPAPACRRWGSCGQPAGRPLGPLRPSPPPRRPVHSVDSKSPRPGARKFPR